MEAIDMAADEGTKVGGLLRGEMPPGSPWGNGWAAGGSPTPRGGGDLPWGWGEADLKSLEGGDAGDELFRLFSILFWSSLAKHIAPQKSWV